MHICDGKFSHVCQLSHPERFVTREILSTFNQSCFHLGHEKDVVFASPFNVQKIGPSFHQPFLLMKFIGYLWAAESRVEALVNLIIGYELLNQWCMPTQIELFSKVIFVIANSWRHKTI